jgi:nucleoside-diphosphate-sugar epimerase
MGARTMRIAVTGVTGFIGSHLAPALADEGHEVLALVRRPDVLATHDGVIPFECDLTEPVVFDLGRIDAIVHLAQANVPLPEGARELYRVNTTSTLELLEWGRRYGVERFVYASSGSIFGLGEGIVDEKTTRRSDDLYAVTKEIAERLVQSYARSYRTTAILRPFAPYGPTQTGRLIPGLIERVREGRPVTLNRGGRPRMTPMYVADAVRAFSGALDIDGHHVVNVAGDEAVSIQELAELIGEALGREPLFEEGPGATGDLVSANEHMYEVLGMDRLVRLADGIRATALAGAPA